MSPILGIWASQNYSRYSLPTSYESIATSTVGSGGSSTITFSSIPSTYKHLQVRVLGRDNGASSEDEYLVTFNSDTAGNYSWHYLWGNGTSVTSSASTSASNIRLFSFPTAVQSAGFGASIIDILDYADTNKYKTLRALTGYDINGTGTIALNSGSWRNTNAISTITITNNRAVNFLQYSSFALYGIKGD